MQKNLQVHGNDGNLTTLSADHWPCRAAARRLRSLFWKALLQLDLRHSATFKPGTCCGSPCFTDRRVLVFDVCMCIAMQRQSHRQKTNNHDLQRLFPFFTALLSHLSPSLILYASHRISSHLTITPEVVCSCPRAAARWSCNQEISRPSHQVKRCVTTTHDRYRIVTYGQMPEIAMTGFRCLQMSAHFAKVDITIAIMLSFIEIKEPIYCLSCLS